MEQFEELIEEYIAEEGASLREFNEECSRLLEGKSISIFDPKPYQVRVWVGTRVGAAWCCEMDGRLAARFLPPPIVASCNPWLMHCTTPTTGIHGHDNVIDGLQGFPQGHGAKGVEGRRREQGTRQ